MSDNSGNSKEVIRTLKQYKKNQRGGLKKKKQSNL